MSDRVDDLVVVLPGILGSVLERDGAPVWNHSLAALRHVLPPHRLAAALQIDEPLRPTRLIKGVHLMPGLWKIDGYGGLLRYLRGSLDFSRGNLVEFPYDWRLSCADNAVQLKETVERELTRWRETVPEARVSYLCHSMGDAAPRGRQGRRRTQPGSGASGEGPTGEVRRVPQPARRSDERVSLGARALADLPMRRHR